MPLLANVKVLILAGLCATILTVYHGALFSGGECIYVPRTLWGENIELRYRAESVNSRHNEATNITANHTTVNNSDAKRHDEKICLGLFPCGE